MNLVCVYNHLSFWVGLSYWKVMFSILCDVIFLVGLQEKFEIDHCVATGEGFTCHFILLLVWSAWPLCHLPTTTACPSSATHTLHAYPGSGSHLGNCPDWWSFWTCTVPNLRGRQNADTLWLQHCWRDHVSQMLTCCARRATFVSDTNCVFWTHEMFLKIFRNINLLCPHGMQQCRH